MTVEQFVKDYLEGQDEIQCSDRNIDALSDALLENGFPYAEDWESISEKERCDLRSTLDDIADKVCVNQVELEDGTLMDWDVVVNAMDDDIREELHSKLTPCSEQKFYDEYCKKHFDKYGSDFEIN